jgi:hypothetical protein
MKSRRLKWVQHVIGMDNERMYIPNFGGKPYRKSLLEKAENPMGE